uniref:U-box domain-containing protein n=1 Tax=Kalanchoe fedtschenkoi TaxID=63787 RepID=A0A7N0UWE8_KALFE
MDSPADTSTASVNRALHLINSDSLHLNLLAAQEIRRLTKTSHRTRRLLAPAIPPLVSMIRSPSPPEFHQAALLALLNLAVKDDKNKITIVDVGGLEPIISFLQSKCMNLQDYATATLLTLSASATLKPTIGASGAIPFLVDILSHGSPQAKAEAITVLYNLSTYPNNLVAILSANPMPSLVDFLKVDKKHSRTAEKCIALIECLVGFDNGRTALTFEEGGLLTVVEVLENGSLQSRGHAVGALLTMCEADRIKYRELILREGVIPGLLELTVQGTSSSQSNARTLLRLLRDSLHPRSGFQPDTLEDVVCTIMSQIDSDDQSSKAKKMLAEMVQVSMEQSLRHLQQRALEGTPLEMSVSTCPSKASLK